VRTGGHQSILTRDTVARHFEAFALAGRLPIPRSRLRAKKPAATRTIIAPGARCSANDRHVPKLVEATEKAMEKSSIPCRL
jgi:hypothetical protein